MKEVRNIWWHTVLIDTLKTETSNFVLNPSLHWKPVQWNVLSSYMPEDKSGCMMLYALKFIQIIVRETSKKRITVVELDIMRETTSILLPDRKERIFPILRNLRNKMRHKYFICAFFESVSSKEKPRFLTD